jgi:hypothetical protein
VRCKALDKNYSLKRRMIAVWIIECCQEIIKNRVVKTYTTADSQDLTTLDIIVDLPTSNKMESGG